MRLRGKRWPSTPVEESQNVTQWWAEQLGTPERTPLYICDGKSVWYNRATQPGAKPMWERSSSVAPVDLMSGEGLGNLAGAAGVKFPLLLYPDLSRKSGWEFEFDAAPKDNPGLVVVMRSARLATTEPKVGHEWYYIDPARGHAVVKAELFTVSVDQPVDPETANVRQTLTMKDLNVSTKGVWSARSVETRQPITQGPGQAVTGHVDSVTRYSLIFDPTLDEDLFEAPLAE